MKRTVDGAKRSRRARRAVFLCVWLFLPTAWLCFGGKVFPAAFLALTVLTPLSFFAQCAAVRRIGLSVQSPALPVQKGQPIDVRITLQIVCCKECIEVTIKGHFAGINRS